MGLSESPTLMSSDKTVATPGTPVALSAASKRVRSVTIIAKDTNTGRVYVGGSTVSASVNAGMQAGDALRHSSAAGWLDLADLYLDAAVAGEGVDFYAVKA